MELNDVMRTTFAARDYTGEEMSDAVLYEILDNARFAPSGGNRQGNRVIVVRDQKTKDALGELNIPGARRYIAQINAGENPWNSYTPTVCTPEEIEATKPASLLTEPVKNCSVALVFIVDLKVVASMDQDLDRVGIISGGSSRSSRRCLSARRSRPHHCPCASLAAATRPIRRPQCPRRRCHAPSCRASALRTPR